MCTSHAIAMTSSREICLTSVLTFRILDGFENLLDQLFDLLELLMKAAMMNICIMSAISVLQDFSLTTTWDKEAYTL